MPKTLDYPRLCKVLGMIDPKTDPGTRANAFDVASRMLEAAGVSWADLGAAHQFQHVLSEMAARRRGQPQPRTPAPSA